MKDRDATSRKMAEMFEDVENSAAAGIEFQVAKRGHPVDVLAGTLMKVLEMVRGRGWDRALTPSAGYGSTWSQPGLGLANIEWVVVDEADVLFGM